MNRIICLLGVVALGLAVYLGLSQAPRTAQAQPAGIAPAPAAAAAQTPAAAKAKAAIDKGLAYLKSKQNKDHSWGEGDIAPGLTGMCLKAFVQAGYDPDTDFIDKGFDRLVEFQKNTGGIYTQALASYNTAIAISALASAPNEVELQEPLKKAVEYLKSLQWSDTIQGLPNGQVIKPGDPRNGGFGYGGGKGHARPDMSNTSFALDALHDAGLKPDDPAYQRVVAFLSHCQNDSETNKNPVDWKPGNDGGFTYCPPSVDNKGSSPAGETLDASGDRMLRSYGSMTYAGLKSMIYAGLSKNDSRVQAAWGWIGKNWTLDENPGMGVEDPKHAKDGLFYYYYTMARALHAYGEPVVTDAQGKKHDWRIELIDKLVSLQKDDGSWVGYQKYMEDNPLIVTNYSVQALQETIQDLKDHPVKP